MRILFYIRGNYEKYKGGDLTQIFNTAKALQRKGLTIDFSTDSKKSLVGYDVVHIFNSPRYQETFRYMKNANKQNKLIAFSTIFWPKDETITNFNPKGKILRFFLGNFLAVQIFKFYQRFKNQDNKHFITEKKLFDMSDILLPNSEKEMAEISKKFNCQKPYAVVRNAVDENAFLKKPYSIRDDYILSVGRIEERKNTLLLIEACHQIKRKLVLIGRLGSDAYGRKCLEKVKKYDFQHLENMEVSKLKKYYYRAKVHAMVSWYETPGLASMEAACGGCNIVSTDRGSTKEYFDDLVHYCNPASRKSIERALKDALKQRFNIKLRSRILKNYTWDNAAEDTIKGYCLLSNKAKFNKLLS